MSSGIHQARLALAALLLAAAATAGAQDTPDVRRLGSITYVSGGVGQDEVAYMRSISAGYNLQLLFALSDTGAYLSDVAVTIKSAAGEQLMAVRSEGPFFYANLPAGSYQVDVAYGGVSQSRKATVGAKGAAVLRFYWPGQQ